MQQGWIFRQKSRFLCLVYEGVEAYRLANADLAKSFETYFQSHPGFLDLMSLDAGNNEQWAFASAIMAKLQFTKKAEPVSTANSGAAPRRV